MTPKHFLSSTLSYFCAIISALAIFTVEQARRRLAPGRMLQASQPLRQWYQVFSGGEPAFLTMS